MADEPVFPLGAYLRLLVLDPEQVPEAARAQLAEVLSELDPASLDEDTLGFLEAALVDEGSGLAARLGPEKLPALRARLDTALGMVPALTAPGLPGLPGWLRSPGGVPPPAPAPELPQRSLQPLWVSAFVLALGGLALVLPGSVTGPGSRVRPLGEARRAVTALPSVEPVSYTPPEVPIREPEPTKAPSPPPGTEVPPDRPWLTDGDGKPIPVDSLEIRVGTFGPLGMVELELGYSNAGPEAIEAVLAVPMPEGAGLARLAREVGGVLHEGEVVTAPEKLRDYVPDLRPGDAPNTVRASAYPIAPGESGRFLLSWTTSRASGPDRVRRFTVPMLGAGRVARMRFRAVCRPLPGEALLAGDMMNLGGRLTRKGAAFVFESAGSLPAYRAERELEIAFRAAEEAPGSHLLRSGEHALLVHRVPAPAKPPPPPPPSRNWTFLVDTSASGSRQAERRLEALRKVLWAAPPDGATIRVGTFSLRALGLDEVWVPGKGLPPSLRNREGPDGFLGGTDLIRALGDLHGAAVKSPAGTSFVLVTDGWATLGSDRRSEVARNMELWPPGKPLHVLVIGPAEDHLLTREIAARGGGRVVRLPLSGDLSVAAATAAAELRRPVGPRVVLEHLRETGGASTHFDDVRPGSELLHFLHVPEAGPVRIRWKVGRNLPIRMTPPVLESEAFRPLLVREEIRARLAGLAQREAELIETIGDSGRRDFTRKNLRRDQLELSLRHRVPSRHARLQLLTSEADYRAHALVRHKLPDLLTLGDEGIVDGLRAATLPRIAREFSAAGDLRGGPLISWRIRDHRGLPNPRPRRERRPPEPYRSEPAPDVPASQGHVWIAGESWRPDGATLASLTEAVRRDPEDASARTALCWAYARLGYAPALEAQALDWMKADPERGEPYEFLAEAHDLAGRPRRAVEAVTSLLDRAPYSVRLRTRVGHLLYRLGESHIAREVFATVDDDGLFDLTDRSDRLRVELRMTPPVPGADLRVASPRGTPALHREVRDDGTISLSHSPGPSQEPLHVGVELPEGLKGPIHGLLLIKGPVYKSQRGYRRSIPFLLPPTDPSGARVRWLARILR